VRVRRADTTIGAQQGFILATLVSTVAGTFITSINLYDRLIEQRRQRKRDKGQNKRIQELEQRLNEAEEEKRQIKDAGGNGNHGNGRDEFRNSLQQSGNMVQHEYDRYFANLGPRFGQGDCKYPPTPAASSPKRETTQALEGPHEDQANRWQISLKWLRRTRSRVK
jgi:hypothetical protein